MAQFINPFDLVIREAGSSYLVCNQSDLGKTADEEYLDGIALQDTQLLVAIPAVSHYKLSLQEDYEEYLPTCPRIGAVVSLSGDLPHIEPLPQSVWEHTYSTHYAAYNRTDLY